MAGELETDPFLSVSLKAGAAIISPVLPPGKRLTNLPPTIGGARTGGFTRQEDCFGAKTAT